MAVLLIALFAFLGRRAQADERLRRDGVQGTGQVLEAEQTGVYVNHQPQVKLRLRVQAPGIEPYEVERRVTVPMIALGSLTGGRPLAVAIDPGDRNRLAIDWGAQRPAPPDPAPPAPSEESAEPLDRLTKLMQLRAANLITDEELQRYRKRILDEGV